MLLYLPTFVAKSLHSRKETSSSHLLKSDCCALVVRRIRDAEANAVLLDHCCCMA